MSNSFSLPDYLNVTFVEQVKDQLLALPAGDCTLDISEIKLVDSSGIQLLLAFQASLKARGFQMHLTGGSEKFDEVSNLLGTKNSFTFVD